MTDDEVRLVIAEARSAGVLEKAESDMIAGVMRIADRPARGLMVPRHEVETVQLSDPPESFIRRFRDTGHSRLPVQDGDADNIVGVFRSRDFLDLKEDHAHIDLKSFLIEAPVVRERMGALDVLEILRRSPAHMVLVYDEYGNFEGIITPMDVLQAIAGDFDGDAEDEPRVVEREDGSLLVAGWMAADEFADRIGITLETDRDYDTVAGLVIDRMGSLPQVGEHVLVSGWRIEVVDLDGRRIDKLLVAREVST